MSKTILIIEDEQFFHELFAIMLEDRDCEIVCAYDGHEALLKLEKKKPDLIILDILLDVITGDTLFRHLKRTPEYADIPVIMVSSVPSHTFKNLRKVEPNLVFIEKPRLERKEFLEEVDKKLIEKVNAREEVVFFVF